MNKKTPNKADKNSQSSSLKSTPIPLGEANNKNNTIFTRQIHHSSKVEIQVNAEQRLLTITDLNTKKSKVYKGEGATKVEMATTQKAHEKLAKRHEEVLNKVLSSNCEVIKTLTTIKDHTQLQDPSEVKQNEAAKIVVQSIKSGKIINFYSLIYGPFLVNFLGKDKNNENNIEIIRFSHTLLPVSFFLATDLKLAQGSYFDRNDNKLYSFSLQSYQKAELKKIQLELHRAYDNQLEDFEDMLESWLGEDLLEPYMDWINERLDMIEGGAQLEEAKNPKSEDDKKSNKDDLSNQDDKDKDDDNEDEEKDNDDENEDDEDQDDDSDENEDDDEDDDEDQDDGDENEDDEDQDDDSDENEDDDDQDDNEDEDEDEDDDQDDDEDEDEEEN